MDPVRFLLVDGQSVTIRTMQLNDLAAIDAMHDRLSRQSLYERYFVAYKPSLDALRKQMWLSQQRGAALVATLDLAPNEIIAMAYYLPFPDDVGMAEPAFLVEDRFQGQGLGSALFYYLIQKALSQTLRGFRIFIHPENRRMLRLLDQKTFYPERHYRDGMFEARLDFQAACE